jgi:hypothetical protein
MGSYNLIKFLLEKSSVDETIEQYERIFDGRIPDAFVYGFIRQHGELPRWCEYIELQDAKEKETERIQDMARNAWIKRRDEGNVKAHELFKHQVALRKQREKIEKELDQEKKQIEIEKDLVNIRASAQQQIDKMVEERDEQMNRFY